MQVLDSASTRVGARFSITRRTKAESTRMSAGGVPSGTDLLQGFSRLQPFALDPFKASPRYCGLTE